MHCLYDIRSLVKGPEGLLGGGGETTGNPRPRIGQRMSLGAWLPLGNQLICIIVAAII